MKNKDTGELAGSYGFAGFLAAWLAGRLRLWLAGSGGLTGFSAALALAGWLAGCLALAAVWLAGWLWVAWLSGCRWLG